MSRYISGTVVFVLICLICDFVCSTPIRGGDPRGDDRPLNLGHPDYQHEWSTFEENQLRYAAHIEQLQNAQQQQQQRQQERALEEEDNTRDIESDIPHEPVQQLVSDAPEPEQSMLHPLYADVASTPEAGAATVVCGVGSTSCGNICFDPASFVCVSALKSTICPTNFPLLCGTASCYSPTQYSCTNGQLQPGATTSTTPAPVITTVAPPPQTTTTTTTTPVTTITTSAACGTMAACGTICYNPSSYVCASASRNFICPITFPALCGASACYNTAQYACNNGQLVPATSSTTPAPVVSTPAPVVSTPAPVISTPPPSVNPNPVPTYPPGVVLGTADEAITYRGGQVMLGAIRVYIVFYGGWSASDSIFRLVPQFVNGLGGSGWWNIQTTYPQTIGGVKSAPTNTISWGKYSTERGTEAGSYSTVISDSNVYAIINKHITNGALPWDPQGLYLVLTAPDVHIQTGFCTSYCGWHTSATASRSFASSGRVRYGLVGSGIRCPSSCLPNLNPSASPNGNRNADGMMSILAHEMAEMVSDPDLSAWLDKSSYENADKCAWNYGQRLGAVYTTSNGARANLKLGGLDWLIQSNWVNHGPGYCGMRY